jgi:hypothetical protein
MRVVLALERRSSGSIVSIFWKASISTARFEIFGLRPVSKFGFAIFLLETKLTFLKSLSLSSLEFTFRLELRDLQLQLSFVDTRFLQVLFQPLHRQMKGSLLLEIFPCREQALEAADLLDGLPLFELELIRQPRRFDSACPSSRFQGAAEFLGTDSAG